jgi:hypothetical protein
MQNIETYLLIPFVVMLLSIAILPLIMPRFWGSNVNKLMLVLLISVPTAMMLTRAGLGDYVCPPSGLEISYLNLATPDKTIHWYQGSDHGQIPQKKEIITWSTTKK